MKNYIFNVALFMACCFSLNGVSYAVLPADFNHDDVVDFHDFCLFAYQWQQQESPQLMADLESMGFVDGNFVDYNSIDYNSVDCNSVDCSCADCSCADCSCVPVLPADFNHDLIVDIQDFYLFAYQWQQEETPELKADLRCMGFFEGYWTCTVKHLEPNCPEPNCEPNCPEPNCEPNCPEPNCPEPNCVEPNCPEPNCVEPNCGEPNCEPNCGEPNCTDCNWVDCNSVKPPGRSFPNKTTIAQCVYDDPCAYVVWGWHYDYIPNCLTLDNNNPGHGGSGGSVRMHLTGQSISPYRLQSMWHFSEPLRLDGSKIIKLRYHVNSWDVPEDKSRFRSIQFRLGYSGGYCEYEPVEYPTKEEQKKELDLGWHEVVVRFDQPELGFDPPVNKDITDVQILLTFLDEHYYGYAPGTVDISFDSLEAYDLITTPQFALTFDDGYSSQYDIANYLYAKGLRATFYVIPSLIDTPFYLTLQQLQTMHQQGHLIANHTWDHLDVNKATDDEYKASIQKAANWLCEHGFADGAFIFCSPKGTPDISNDKIDAAMELVRQVRLTYPPTYVPDAYYLDFNPELLYAAGLGSGNDLTSCEYALHDAYTEQTFRCVYFHSYFLGLLPYIDEVAEDVAEGKIECVRIDEILSN